MSVKSLHPG